MFPEFGGPNLTRLHFKLAAVLIVLKGEIHERRQVPIMSVWEWQEAEILLL